MPWKWSRVSGRHCPHSIRNALLRTFYTSYIVRSRPQREARCAPPEPLRLLGRLLPAGQEPAVGDTRLQSTSRCLFADVKEGAAGL
jgi:hypothetical protein